jgi:hypothetical protein
MVEGEERREKREGGGSFAALRMTRGRLALTLSC